MRYVGALAFVTLAILGGFAVGAYRAYVSEPEVSYAETLAACESAVQVQSHMTELGKREIQLPLAEYLRILKTVQGELAAHDEKLLQEYQDQYRRVVELSRAVGGHSELAPPLRFPVENARVVLARRVDELMARQIAKQESLGAAYRVIVVGGRADLELCNPYDSALRFCASVDLASGELTGATPFEALNHPGIYRHKAIGYGDGRTIRAESGKTYSLTDAQKLLARKCPAEAVSALARFKVESDFSGEQRRFLGPGPQEEKLDLFAPKKPALASQ